MQDKEPQIAEIRARQAARKQLFTERRPFDSQTVIWDIDYLLSALDEARVEATQAYHAYARDAEDKARSIEYHFTVAASLRERLAASEAMQKRWKYAVEGLTPNGSEYVDDPEACAAAIRKRCQYPQMIIELRARLVEVEAKAAIAKTEAFDKGVEEGRATQAILELQGRDRFIAELKESILPAELVAAKEGVARLTAELNSLRTPAVDGQEKKNLG